MNHVKIVSGYIPLPEVVNVDETRFRKLGVLLHDALPYEDRKLSAEFFDETDEDGIFDTWIWRWAQKNGLNLEPSDPDPDPARFDPPVEGKLLSNFVMHQKYEWLALAAIEDPDPNIFCWIDYGVLKQSGMTPEVITDFCDRLVDCPSEYLNGRITAPGIRHTISAPVPEESWDRFCGSVVIVPRDMVFKLANEMKRQAMKTIRATNKVTIETNTLAELEYFKILNFNWYGAYWGAGMFANFQPPTPYQTC